MKKLLVGCMLCVSLFFAGCASGEITLEISRMGTAEVTCQLMTTPFLQQAIASFRKDFVDDGFDVHDAANSSMSGFIAHKSYLDVRKIKDSKVLKVFRFTPPRIPSKASSKSPAEANKSQSGQPAVQPGSKPSGQKADSKDAIVSIKQGLLYDTVTIDTHLNLDPNLSSEKEKEQWILQSLMQQVDLRFVLKLPTYTDSNNATRVEDEGKTLIWVLPVGVDTPMKATATFLNLYKAAGWISAVVVIVIVGIVVVSYRRRKTA